MSRKRRGQRKPSTPRVVAAEPQPVQLTTETDGLNLDALRLEANNDVKAEKENRKHIARAQRLDVFALLVTRKTGARRDQPPALSTQHYEAIRRLEQDVHTAAGAAGTGEVRDYVSGSGCSELVTQRMVEASRSLQRVFRFMNHRQSVELSLALLSPINQGNVLTRWRAEVERITKKRDEPLQVKAVVDLCATVAGAYAACDNEPRHHPLTNPPKSVAIR